METIIIHLLNIQTAGRKSKWSFGFNNWLNFLWHLWQQRQYSTRDSTCSTICGVKKELQDNIKTFQTSQQWSMVEAASSCRAKNHRNAVRHIKRLDAQLWFKWHVLCGELCCTTTHGWIVVSRIVRDQMWVNFIKFICILHNNMKMAVWWLTLSRSWVKQQDSDPENQSKSITK